MRSFEERSRNLPLDFAQSKALLVLAENVPGELIVPTYVIEYMALMRKRTEVGE